jgi:predicted metal-dependent peptidase
MKFDLNRHTARLLMSEPFFAALSRKIDKRASTSIKTAGVRINEETGQFEMLYNPDFFAKLPDEQKLGVLKHEFYHLIFEHVTGRLPEGKMTRIWNVATDLAINSHISHELPDLCLAPGKGQFEHLPTGKSAEWYLNTLKKEQKEKKEEDKGNKKEQGEGSGSGSGSGSDDSGDGEEEENNNNGGGSDDNSDEEENKEDKKENSDSDKKEEEPDSFDDHSGWGEASQQTKEIAKQRIKEHIKQAAQEADKANNWGTVSSELRREIKERLATHIDWRKVLRYFVKTSERANKTSSIKRINRRYAYIHPGKKVKRQARIAISIDQSGSVDDEMLAAFYAELNKLSDIAEFTVIPFDDQVFEQKVYVWKKGEKKKKERVLCGGTCFDAPTAYVNKLGFDGHIVLTDMYAPKPKASKCQRMWMTTEYNAKHPYFQTNERVIAITK